MSKFSQRLSGAMGVDQLRAIRQARFTMQYDFLEECSVMCFFTSRYLLERKEDLGFM
jgi:hypothetical protein